MNSHIYTLNVYKFMEFYCFLKIFLEFFNYVVLFTINSILQLKENNNDKKNSGVGMYLILC